MEQIWNPSCGNIEKNTQNFSGAACTPIQIAVNVPYVPCSCGHEILHVFIYTVYKRSLFMQTVTPQKNTYNLPYVHLRSESFFELILIICADFSTVCFSGYHEESENLKSLNLKHCVLHRKKQCSEYHCLQVNRTFFLNNRYDPSLRFRFIVLKKKGKLSAGYN